MVDDLVAFLRARLAEDERVARAAAGVRGGGEWTADFTENMGRYEVSGRYRPDEHGYPDLPVVVDPDEDATAQHIARHDPARVLREVNAKRQILHEHRQELEGWCETCDVPGDARGDEVGCLTVRLLALPYADHPDYRPEWAPTA